MLQISDLQFQVIAFLLEFVGLTLAFIESAYAQYAENIARFLGKLASPIEDLRSRSVDGTKAYERLSASLGKLLSTVLTLGTFPLVILFAVKATEAFVSDELTVTWLVPELIVFVVQLLVVSICLLLLSLVLYFTVAGAQTLRRDL